MQNQSHTTLVSTLTRSPVNKTNYYIIKFTNQQKRIFLQKVAKHLINIDVNFTSAVSITDNLLVLFLNFDC